MLSAEDIVELHDQLTESWHGNAGVANGEEKTDWLAAVARHHRANFELWHIEDEARTPGASDAELAQVKRRVDLTNQRRNDLAEELDSALLAWLAQVSKDDGGAIEAGEEHTSGAKAPLNDPVSSARLKSCPDTRRIPDSLFGESIFAGPLPNPDAALHSESPGLAIDRLSILALKIYHTREEARRTGAPEGHAQRNRERLAILTEQRADLAHCLDALWRETLAGTRRFKLYRQLKMYNDPSLNPAVYRKLDQEPGS
jgi:hypothetical protein